ncbi:MAG: KOW domain-containing protein [Peptoniphilus sp.]
MDKTLSLLKGQVVRSKKGRDEGKVYIIMEIIDDDLLLLVDGKLRKLDRPKKKKVKHLYIYKDVIDTELNFNDLY